MIEELFLEPIASETRGASDKSMAEKNEEEVRNSDVYVGIFGSEYSPPTMKELEVARKQKIPVLIYVKDKSPHGRDQELEDFIRKIIYRQYNTSEDFDFRLRLYDYSSSLVRESFRVLPHPQTGDISPAFKFRIDHYFPVARIVAALQ